MDLYTLGERKCALYAVIPDNDTSFTFLVSLLYSQIFQTLYYCADQIHHGALPCHVHFILDEAPSVNLPGLPRELATMRSRNISCSTIIQNMAQIKEQFKDSWETIPGNSDTLLYLGGNESSTHKYISEALGKSTIDTKTHGETKGKSGSWSTNMQISGRELLTPDAAVYLERAANPDRRTAYDLIAVEKGRVIAAGWSGKVKTASTMVCICLMLFGIPHWLNLACQGVILVTTVYSGVEYFVKNWDVFSEK